MRLDRLGPTDGSAGLQGVMTELQSADTAPVLLRLLYHELTLNSKTDRGPCNVDNTAGTPPPLRNNKRD